MTSYRAHIRIEHEFARVPMRLLLIIECIGFPSFAKLSIIINGRRKKMKEVVFDEKSYMVVLITKILINNKSVDKQSEMIIILSFTKYFT